MLSPACDPSPLAFEQTNPYGCSSWVPRCQGRRSAWSPFHDQSPIPFETLPSTTKVYKSILGFSKVLPGRPPLLIVPGDFVKTYEAGPGWGRGQAAQHSGSSHLQAAFITLVKQKHRWSAKRVLSWSMSSPKGSLLRWPIDTWGWRAWL